MHYDVLIIGAGMSGLAAGIRAAYFGRRVLIVEQHAMWGGLNSFYKKGGHAFDVGLHAVTNWLRPDYRGPRIPLQRIFRQLRISPDEWALEPQTQSSVRSGDLRLNFTNDLAVLESEVERTFPGQVDGFRRLCEACREYPAAEETAHFVSTCSVLADYLSEPLLIDMLLCPLMFYGSASEHDLDFSQFVILFNSIYREGFCRPRRGVRQILDVLVKRYRELGGKLQRRCAVEALVVKDGRVTEVRLSEGEPVTADVILSSAGLVETMALRSDQSGQQKIDRAGQLAFVENLWVLDQNPRELGFEDCITFFFDAAPFQWRSPEAPVDLSSGVICIPSNYAHAEPLDRWLVRATHLADHKTWFGYGEEVYAQEKAQWMDASVRTVERFGGSFASHITYADGFTPKTVRHYTGHANGAVYGSPYKQASGNIGLENLFLCGTDQGFVGIVGAMLSGINMANRYALAR